MTIETRYENQMFDYMEGIRNSIRAQPLYLGATSSGTGRPPGGFIGFLPQTRVSYDEQELATTATPVSGTLLDNLNHIRYNHLAFSGAVASGVYASGISVSLSGIAVATDVLTINFEGNVAVTDEGNDEVKIKINPSSPQPHIIDATGTLEDLTTKFNTLLAALETMGMLESS